MTYTNAELNLIFDKAAPSALDPDYRVDCDGNVIYRYHHGLASSFGWQVDHIVPRALKGSDELFNLRPRHHVTNQLAGALLGGAIQRQKSSLGRLLGSGALPEPKPSPSGAFGAGLFAPRKRGAF